MNNNIYLVNNNKGDVNKMNENMELIMHIYKDADMGVYTTTCLINLLTKKENKIKYVIEEEIKEYEKFLNESKKILEKNDIKPKGSGMMAKLSSDMGIKMETIKDNSDAAIAGMIIEGFTMGIVNMQAKIKRYKSIADKKYLKIADDFLKFQESEVEKLKVFL